MANMCEEQYRREQQLHQDIKQEGREKAAKRNARLPFRADLGVKGIGAPWEG
jgi:hypothetical protein